MLATLHDEALRILVMDGHAETARAMVRLLELEGHSATGVGDCRAGVAAARAAARSKAGPFDLLVSDIGLPDHDGCQLLAALLKTGRPMRAFAVTDYGMGGDVARLREAGFVEYFLKPYSVGELLAAVGRVAMAVAAERREPRPAPVLPYDTAPPTPAAASGRAAPPRRGQRRRRPRGGDPAPG